MPILSRITLYPIKGFPGVDLPQARLTSAGALLHDRAYALVDSEGGFINGKRKPRVHTLRATLTFEGEALRVTLDTAQGMQVFRLTESTAHAQERQKLEAWLSDWFGEPVRFIHQPAGGFPDDPSAPGPTIVSRASIQAVASWFPQLDAHRLGERFRSNLELDDCAAFWEDRVFGAAGDEVGFRIGESSFAGTNPCKRCVVPSRDPSSGEVTDGFQRRFVERRQQTLPAWAERSQFDTFYRLAVNTRAAGDLSGCVIRVGDPVALTVSPFAE